jgi:hypothetical protein
MNKINPASKEGRKLSSRLISNVLKTKGKSIAWDKRTGLVVTKDCVLSDDAKIDLLRSGPKPRGKF